MPDWKMLLRRRMGQLDLPPGSEKEVISELAEHLQETYQHALSHGLTSRAAIRLALQEVDDWRVLAVNIRRAKESSMNHRTKSLWLPALITLFGASVSLAVIQFLRLQPRLVWVGGWGMTFYWQWLATLPLLGAVGAYLSQRAEGRVRARLAAGLSPALIMLIVISLILPWGLAIDGFHFFRLVGFGLGLFNWVVIPAAALLIGAVPFAFRSGWNERVDA